MTSRTDGILLVLGVGNVLLGDDGVGVHAVVALRAAAERGEITLPPDTSVVDGGTLGRDLLPILDEARAVVLVDAVVADRPPGTVTISRGDDLRRRRGETVALGRIGVDDLLDAATVAGVLPDAVTLVGVVPDRIDVGLELSDAVREAVPTTVGTIVEELQRFDEISEPRTGSIRGAYDMTGALA